MMSVNRSSVADNFSQNFRAALLGAVERFEIHNRRAFAERKAVAVRVERAADRG